MGDFSSLSSYVWAFYRSRPAPTLLLWLRLLPFTGSASGKLGDERANRTAGSVRGWKEDGRKDESEEKLRADAFSYAAFMLLCGASPDLHSWRLRSCSGAPGPAVGMGRRLKPGELIRIKLGCASYPGSDQRSVRSWCQLAP